MRWHLLSSRDKTAKKAEAKCPLECQWSTPACVRPRWSVRSCSGGCCSMWRLSHEWVWVWQLVNCMISGQQQLFWRQNVANSHGRSMFRPWSNIMRQGTHLQICSQTFGLKYVSQLRADICMNNGLTHGQQEMTPTQSFLLIICKCPFIFTVSSWECRIMDQ